MIAGGVSFWIQSDLLYREFPDLDETSAAHDER